MNKDIQKNNRKELIKEALREYQQEETKKKKNRVYHNTELLMKNYNELKQHADNAIYKLSQVLSDDSKVTDSSDCELGLVHYSTGLDYESDFDPRNEDMYIGVILKSKVRTAVMVHHIEVALEILKNNALKGKYIEKYGTLVGLYIFNQSYDELAEYYHCDSSTIRRWKIDILKKLGIILFGEEGLILWA